MGTTEVAKVLKQTDWQEQAPRKNTVNPWNSPYYRQEYLPDSLS